MSMSFDYPSYSPELATAIKYSNSKGVITVASAGNSGEDTMVYPGGTSWSYDVASTSKHGMSSLHLRITACRRGMAAPGEGFDDLFPGYVGRGMGTSFSTPFRSGDSRLS